MDCFLCICGVCRLCIFKDLAQTDLSPVHRIKALWYNSPGCESGRKKNHPRSPGKICGKIFGYKAQRDGTFVSQQMSELLPLLEVNRTYRAHTHVKLLFEKTHRDGKITICKMRKTRKRWLLTEAVVLWGFGIHFVSFSLRSIAAVFTSNFTK